MAENRNLERSYDHFWKLDLNYNCRNGIPKSYPFNLATKKRVAKISIVTTLSNIENTNNRIKSPQPGISNTLD